MRDYFTAKIHTLVIFTNLPNNNVKKQVGQILFILFYRGGVGAWIDRGILYFIAILFYCSPQIQLLFIYFFTN